jgi:hypothetical protein
MLGVPVCAECTVVPRRKVHGKEMHEGRGWPKVQAPEKRIGIHCYEVIIRLYNEIVILCGRM